MEYTKGEFLTLDDFDLGGRTVLTRIDINSPLDPESGRILDDHRIKSHLETIRELEDTKLVIVAHQSRPGKNDYTTLEGHARRLNQLLGKKVEYVDGLFDKNTREKIKDMDEGDKLLLENARFYAEETYLKGDPDWEKHQNSHIVQNLSPLIDYFVHDAFAAAHRAQPTLIGFVEEVPSLAGRVMEKEISDMGKAFEGDEEDKIALLGGMKVEDSLTIARHMLEDDIMDRVLTMGVVGNIFLMAEGHELGEGNQEFLRKEVSDYEEQVEKARELLEDWEEDILIPEDVVLNVEGDRKGVPLDDLPSEYPVFDIGLDTMTDYIHEIQDSSLVIMNGPAGAFEIEEFSVGTTGILEAIADSDAFSIIGGGHTSAAVEQLELESSMSHISTGGGSCINFLAGRSMPGLEALKRSKDIFG